MLLVRYLLLDIFDVSIAECLGAPVRGNPSFLERTYDEVRRRFALPRYPWFRWHNLKD
jgi:hypothetical protein